MCRNRFVLSSLQVKVLVWILLQLLLLQNVTYCQPGIAQRFLTADPPPPTAHHELPELKHPDDDLCTSINDEKSVQEESNQEETIAMAMDDSENISGADEVHPTEFFGVFHKLGTNWNSVLTIYRNVVGSAGGTTHKGDIYADNVDQALVVLKEMISAAAESADVSSHQWEFTSVPLKEIDPKLSLDDLFMAFVKWAEADHAPDAPIETCSLRGGVNGRHEKINVSKAFRRLEKYASWMDADREDLTVPPLTAASIERAWEAFSFRLSYDTCHRLVWWLDLDAVDFHAIRNTLSPQEIHRLFVWMSHFMLFNKHAQDKGMVFINSLANIKFLPFMTMLPLQLGMKLDEFMISVIPLKTKLVLLLDRPKWAKFAFRYLLRPFLTKNMRKRSVVLEDDPQQKLVSEALGGGTDCIPIGFNGLDGNPEADIANAYFYSKVEESKTQHK